MLICKMQYQYILTYVVKCRISIYLYIYTERVISLYTHIYSKMQIQYIPAYTQSHVTCRLIYKMQYQYIRTHVVKCSISIFSYIYRGKCRLIARVG